MRPGGGQGTISIYICRLTNIGIPILVIRRSHDSLIFIMEIFIPGKTVFILRRPPGRDEEITEEGKQEGRC